jgi:hydroxymethylpyrimidine kinase/phosphomethylpyrimidine kinase/thiamine-phosphate diphosphorylase
MNKPIVWTIAGSDSSGGAGIAADLLTFQSFGVHGCSVVSALTAQNSCQVTQIEFCSPSMLQAQFEALANDMPPVAIKIGMVGHIDTLKTILSCLKQLNCPVVYDPVLFASVGDALHQGSLRAFLLEHFFPHIDILTPNVPEAEWLLERAIQSTKDMEEAAKELCQMGIGAVLLKGGHLANSIFAQDFWTDGKQSGWLYSPKAPTKHLHGTGCTLSSALTAALALGYDLQESFVLAKTYINQAIRNSTQLGKGAGSVGHAGFPNRQEDLPSAVLTDTQCKEHPAFASCGPEPLGFYPIVDTAHWVNMLLKAGVNTLQLRIKDKSHSQIIEEIKESIALAKQYQARLFINDYWQEALALGAYGVHLGQEDIEQADLEALQQQGLRLGISTHSYYEVARALTYKPSYVACGPIFATQTKVMEKGPQGLLRLKAYCQMLNYPIVAIGGIKLTHLKEIRKAGADGVAVITAITKANDPVEETSLWLKQF